MIILAKGSSCLYDGAPKINEFIPKAFFFTPTAIDYYRFTQGQDPEVFLKQMVTQMNIKGAYIRRKNGIATWILANGAELAGHMQ